MKFWLALMMLCLAGAARAEDRPSLLLYISQDYSQDVQIGLYPYWAVWVDRVDSAKSSIRKGLAPYFKSIDECEGTNVGDLIARVKPQLAFNPGVGIYYAQIRIEFNLGDGRHLRTFKAVGQHFGSMGSAFVQDDVNKAFDAAMQNIVEQYVADTKLQESIRADMASDFNRAPCAMVGLVPSR